MGLLPPARALQTHHPSTEIALYDLYGHGLSSTPLVTHTPAIFHAQLVKVLDFLGWQEVHLVGYSFGGGVVAGLIAGLAVGPGEAEEGNGRWTGTVRSVTMLAPGGVVQ